MKTTSLFKTQDKITEAINSFKTLPQHPGWINFVKILDANIEIVRDQILNKPGDSTEDDMDRLRDNLKLMEQMRNTPEMMIEKLTPIDDEDADRVVDPDEVYD